MASYSYPGNARPRGLEIGGRVISTTQTAWVGYILALLTYAVVFGEWQKVPVPDDVHALGVLVAALCFFPMALWTARGSREIPAFELICIAYLMAFSVPIYVLPNRITIFSEPMYFTWADTARAVSLAAIGIAALIGGYYLALSNKFQLNALQLDLPLAPHKRLTFVKLALLLGFIPLIAGGAGRSADAGVFNSLVSVLQNLTNVAIVILGYRVVRGQENSQWKLVLYGAATLSALLGLTAGMLEAAVVPLLLVIIVRWNVSRRLPWGLLGVGLCVFILLNSLKMSYRAQTWGATRHIGITERIGIWADLLTGGGVASHKQTSFQDSFGKTMSRFDLLHNFVRVQQLTPGTVPYYEGSTYGYLFYGWIPRFLWPDKPIAQGANVTFAVAYGFLAPEQTSSVMIGIGHLPEAYANFGVGGIVFVMALQGAFLAFIGKMLNGPHSEGGKAIYLAIMIFFLNGIGSSTAALFMSVPQTLIISSLILRLFATGWRAHPQLQHR